MNSKSSAQEIVACVVEAWRNGSDDDAVQVQLEAMGLHSAEATEAIELVRSGIARAALMAAGMRADQFSSDVDNDPIFLAAMKAGHSEVANTLSKPATDKKGALAELASDDVEARRRAAYELGEFNDSRATAQLLAALDDQDIYVRTYAMQSLAKLKAKDAVGPCCALLQADQPRLVHVNAIRALGEIGDPAAVPALIEATRHANAFVRHDAAWALGELGDPHAMEALEALLSDKTIPVEKDEDGFTSQTSIYSVSDQAERALSRIRKRGSALSPLSARQDLALSLAWTAVGGIVLGLFTYAAFTRGSTSILSMLGIAGGGLVLVVGLFGLFHRLKETKRQD